MSRRRVYKLLTLYLTYKRLVPILDTLSIGEGTLELLVIISLIKNVLRYVLLNQSSQLLCSYSKLISSLKFRNLLTMSNLKEPVQHLLGSNTQFFLFIDTNV